MIEKVTGFLFYTVTFPIVIASEGFERAFGLLLGYQVFAYPIILIIHDWSGEDWFTIRKLRKFLLVNRISITGYAILVVLYLLHFISITNAHRTIIFAPVFGALGRSWIRYKIFRNQRHILRMAQRLLVLIFSIWQLAPFLVALMLRFQKERNIEKDLVIMSLASVAQTVYWSAIGSGILALPKLWQ